MGERTGDGAAATAGGGEGLAERLFAGPGEMRARCRALDWGATPLGPAEGWPQSLRTAVSVCLAAGFPKLVMWGPELVQIYNDAFRAVLQAKHPAGLGQRARDCWPELWATIGPMYRGVLESGTSIFLEDQLFAPERRGEAGQAEEAYFTFSYSAIPDESHRPAGILATVIETTRHVQSRGERERTLERANAELRAAAAERERLHAQLAAERERLRSVVLQTPAPLALLEGPEHRFALVNDAYRRISGGGRDITGLTSREAFPELAHGDINELFDRVYASGEAWDGPESLVRYDRDGTGVQDAWFDLRLEPVRDAAGRVVAMLNFAVDVTGQVRARHEFERLLASTEAARAEAERAALITNRVTTHLADGVCLMDAEGRLTYMNPAAERTLGWSEAELLGDVLHDRVHYRRPDGRPFPMHECPLAQVLDEARPVLGLPDQWIRRDGSFVHVVTTCSPIVSEGRVVGAVLSLHDDTDRRQAEAERERLLADAEAARTAAEEARSAAEAANRAKSEFLAIMSHELRTPLNAIGGYAELIELGIHGPVTEAQRTALERIQRSQRHLLGLIAGVLDYSRVEAGAVTYRLADVPVTEAVAEAELLIAPQLRAKGLGYAWSGAAPGLRVRADREKLQQILLNLLGNAVKFTHGRDGAPGRIEVACAVEATDAARVVIHVRDTGEGIAPGELERIFEPFVQADQRLTRPHAGVGLGLAISRDLARGMGGDLTAESTPGVGSTFTLTLPRA